MTPTGMTEPLALLLVCVFLLVLVAMTAFLEGNEKAGRWADAALRRLFGEPGEWE